MKKIIPYIVFGSVLLVMATLTCVAKDSFTGKFKRSDTGGIMEFTNTLGRVGIASAFLSGAFSVGNTGTVSVISVDGSDTNVLVSDAFVKTLAWVDQGGAVQLDRNEIIRYEWTETGTTATAKMSGFAR